jgi:hypothetical protein
MSEDVRAIIRQELQRSRPDYVAYVPGHWDGSTNDSESDHFLVWEGPGSYLMALWVLCSRREDNVEGRGAAINRVMFMRSPDDGVTWEPPQRLAGPPDDNEPPYMASWAFPMVSRSGRIYVIWNQNQGVAGRIAMHTGTMAGRYSDDNGITWSEPAGIAMPRSPYDDPDPAIPPEWIVWQKPIRDLKGGYITGYTRWLSEAAARPSAAKGWTQFESVVEFMRFENTDDDPPPEHLRIRYSAWGDQALRVPNWLEPLISVAQEPSLVRLPDQRLFCTLRTNTGYIWYSESHDDGETWLSPRPLLRKDHGLPILEPVSCCPIYQLADGRYVLIHHNNRGDIAQPSSTWYPRRPAFVALGEFRSGADQPLWFSESKLLMDNDGYGVNGKQGAAGAYLGDIGVYCSMTTRNGNNVLWHPERKFFLLGKRITGEWLADLQVLA